MSPAVEYLSDRAEALLTSCVPYLQLKNLVLHADQVGAKLDAHSHIMILLEFILNKSLEDTRFSDA
jgi:hypothetical protein